MKTLEFQAEVGEDGKLRVELPTGLPPGPVEGVIVIQPTNHKQTPPYDTLKGALAGQLPDIDIEAHIGEIPTGWKSDLNVEHSI